MCIGVQYPVGERDYQIMFVTPSAQLPLRTRDGVTLIPWGRRPKQRGKLPLGGCAYRDAVLAGNWDRFQPRAVRLWITAFAENDVEGKTHWVELTRGKWIKGLLAKESSEQRVYVVTITPTLPETSYERWPDIESG